MSKDTTVVLLRPYQRECLRRFQLMGRSVRFVCDEPHRAVGPVAVSAGMRVVGVTGTPMREDGRRIELDDGADDE